MRETRYAEEFLPQLLAGVSVERVAPGADQTPDLLVTCKGARYLIEEKERRDSPEYLEKRSAVLAAGGLHLNDVQRVRDNTLSGIVGDANKQLCSFAAPADFRLIWLTATGTRAEGRFHQFIATLYGTTNISSLNASDLRKCYFFRNSDFHRHLRTLDGAVAAYVSQNKLTAKLCLNPLSPRYDPFRNSLLAQAFGTAILDPRAEESEGVAYILDSDIDRRDEDGALNYLSAKYRAGPLQTCDTGYFSAEVTVCVPDASDNLK